MTTYLVVASIFFLASLLRGVLGFTTSFLVIPLLLNLDLSPSRCVTLLLSASLVQSLVGTRTLRAYIPWPEVRQATLWRLLGLPAGVLCVSYLDILGTSNLKNLVSLCVLLAIGAKLCWPRTLKFGERFREASVLSGFMLGSLGSGGAPLVLWASSKRWDNKTARAFYFAASLLCVPLGLFSLVLGFGWLVVTPLLWGLSYSPIMYFGARLGIRLGSRLPQEGMRGLAFSFLGLGSLLTLLS